MLKMFSNVFNNKNNVLKYYKAILPKFKFGSKSLKGGSLQLKDQEGENLENYELDGEKLDYIKVYKGMYPYMPLDDHPLIPGYARMIAVTREITEKLKEVNAEKTKLVISVLRNPEKVEALQPSM